MKLDNCYQQMDEWSKTATPFLFIINFDKNAPLLYSLSELNEKESPIFYHFPRINNDKLIMNSDYNNGVRIAPKHCFNEIVAYKQSFHQAISLMHKKGVDVINLTKPTSLIVEGSMEDIYVKAKSKYKLLLKDKFVCCSPEIFVRIDPDGLISTYPMKGTIDANIPNAEQIVLESHKEESEHYATVKVLENELSEVADDVKIARYRYLDRLTTSDRDLYQVSSEVIGRLKPEYQNRIGALMNKMLPAGSIVGAPKIKAFEIIKSVEGYDRGYYTGVCGVFDGVSLDSFVLIRYVEKRDDGYIYKSGGGITIESNCNDEYNEILKKIYVPLD